MAPVGTQQAALSLPSARVFKVTAEDRVQTLLCEGPLSLSGGDTANGAQAQVGHVAWKLRQDLPVLEVSPFVYTFVLPGEQHHYYCLMLPIDTPSASLEVLDALLSRYSKFYASEPAPAPSGAAGTAAAVAAPAAGVPGGAPSSSQAAVAGAPGPPGVPAPPPSGLRTESEGILSNFTSDNKMAQNIVAGAMTAGRWISAGTEATTSYINRNSQAVIDRTEAPQQPTQISTAAKISFKSAATVMAGLATASGAVVGGITNVSAIVANKVAGAVVASPLVPSSQSENVRALGAASVLAAGHILESMEAAALVVVDTSGKAVKEVVRRKHGDEAASLAGLGGNIANNTLETAGNARLFSTRVFVRKQAQILGSAMVHQLTERGDSQAAGAGTPAPGAGPSALTSAALAAAPITGR